MGTPQSGPFSSWTRQGDVWGDLGAGKEERGVWFRLSNVPWSQAQSIHDIPKKEEDLENSGIWENLGFGKLLGNFGARGQGSGRVTPAVREPEILALGVPGRIWGG